ncbi:DUF6773 family protein [Bacillus massiliigorillae]|uniref:DUF6773 family protein n=1 Tax=Bacillus massiliigorillae TaxID=1243664 RepID=UPI0003AA4389|nr:DUF6773 family protein [Bacillus massiliigorillae]
MMLLKRTHKVKDERIENTRNMIYKELYHIIMACCVISMLVKTYKYGIGNQDFVLEYIIIFGGSLYYLARSVSLGVFSDEVEMHDRQSKTPLSKKTLYGSIGFAVVMSIVMGVNSAVSYAEGSSQGLWYFTLVALVSILIYLPFLLLLSGGIFYISKKISSKKQEDDK